jgi:hypothetical protein
MSESPILDQLSTVIADEPVDEVLIALPIHKYGPLVDTIVRTVKSKGLSCAFEPKCSIRGVARYYTDELEGIPVVTIQSGPEDGWQLIAKRVIDILGSAGLLLVLAPVFAIVTLLIRLDSAGPILFAQERVGLNKRRFRMLKFRTIGKDAKRLLLPN